LKDAHNILIVDDEALVRKLVALKLAKSGCTILQAETGEQALEIIQSNKIDMVLLDFEMPHMNGLEVLKRIRLQYSALQLPVIMVTANNNDEDIINAFHIGANDYLLKPLNFQVAEARIRTQLMHSYITELKDSFLQFARHDLKKPVLLINDIAESLKETLPENSIVASDIPELFDMIIQTTQSTQKIIDGFLSDNNSAQDKITLHEQIIDINAIVENIYAANQGYSKQKKISLKLELTNEKYQLYSDHFRVTQIIDNLLGNALKFGPPDTDIKITTYVNDDFIKVDICDAGPGIPDTDLPRLFVKHAQLSNKPTGNETSTGIGLALCKELARQINAELSVKNNPQRGCTFRLTLPLGDMNLTTPHVD